MLLCWLGVACALQAAPNFPALSGRVVDEANLLSAHVKTFLTQELELHESESTNQVVVVTLKSLQGYTIEDYGYQLGRAWGIGQKDKNNGVLLIVAPNEHKVRIEVGYGLEGELTDALSNNIIQTQILPQFREKNFERGIINGTDAILSALHGSYQPVEPRRQRSRHSDSGFSVLVIIFIATLIFGEFMVNGFGLKRPVSGVLILVIITILGTVVIGFFAIGLIAGIIALIFHLANGGSGRGGGGGYYGGGYYSGGGWTGGGGFSGGGGSFGGGGASGGW